MVPGSPRLWAPRHHCGTYGFASTYGFTVMVNVDVVFWMLT